MLVLVRVAPAIKATEGSLLYAARLRFSEARL